MSRVKQPKFSLARAVTWRAILVATCALGLRTAQAQVIGNGIDPGQNDSTSLPRAGTGVTNPGSIDPADDQGGGGGGGGDDSGAKKSDSPPPPPALPGSHAQPTEVVPADKVVADMEPTAALFDAINRGDTVAARDAISRGANLDGRNVLGLTPIELAVDLNRNDISFLLLSMRGSVGAGSPTRPAATDPHLAGQAAIVASVKERRGHRLPDQAIAANGVGAPVPSAGFLGFGNAGGS